MSVKPFFIVKWNPPAEVEKLSKPDRLRYWAIAAQAVLARKDEDLANGLAADGKPLGRPSVGWLRRRRSKMLPPGVKGDPKSPLFQPGNGISRVRSLLTAKGYDGYVRVWWRYDSNSQAEFGEILASWAQKRGKRWNVLGMPPVSVEAARKAANRQWKTQARTNLPLPTAKPLQPLPVVRSTRRPTTLDLHTGNMEDIARASQEGRFSGWRTAKELEEWWKEGRAVPDSVIRRPERTAPVILRGITNRQLEHTWKAAETPPGFINKVKSAVNRVFAAFGI